jgi:hypothetical protein
VSTLPSWTAGVDVTRWFEQTAWWDGPTLARAPQQALAELLEAVAGRFTGRELSLQLRGHAVRFQVDAVQVRGRPTATPADDPFGWFADATRLRDVVWWSRGMLGFDNRGAAAPIDAVEFDAHSVSVDEQLVGTVAVKVDGVRLEPTVPWPEIVTGPIAFDVRTTRGDVLTWIHRFFPEWDVRLHRDDLLVVRGPGWRLPLLVRATVAPTTVHTEAVGVIVLGRAVKLPRFLVRTRTLPVPALDPAVTLDAVTIDGDDVVLAFRHEGVRQRVHLDALRAAVRDGATRLGNSIFG